MSRYSIDIPGSDDEHEASTMFDTGESPTDRDYDLLDEEDEISGALNDSSSTRPKGSWFKGSRKVSWGPSYTQVAGNDKHDKSHRLETFNSNINVSDSDSEFDSDIEVDVETHPRRRRRSAAVTRKLHLLLFLVIILIGLLFYSSVLNPTPRSRHVPLKKRLLNNGTHDFHPTTLVISLDGMHPHYVSHDLTPNMHKLFTEEAAAPYMIPSFPSSTFPNHWTLLTGLYPAKHGVVGNTFWDESTSRQFINVKPELSLDPYWWGGEPIWKTANMQNVKTAVHMWPGSEVHWTNEIDIPMHVDKFNGTELLPMKAKRVFEWIDSAELEDRPELILTYVPNVDALGHQYGIYGPEIRNVLTETDNLIGLLMDGLKQRNLEDIVNFVVLSDHGMAPTNNSRIVYLEDLVDPSDYAHVDGSPLVALRPKAGASIKIENVYKELKAKEPTDGSWQVYLDSNMPKEWHFGGVHTEYQSRMAPLWIVPGVGYVVTTREKLEQMGGVYHPFGVHGYNNSEALMRATFLAQGPFFGKTVRYAPFPNTDVYNILCATLDLIPAPNDGSKQVLKPLPSHWVDDQAYPNVKFHTEILKVNSTYDLLFDDDHTAGYQPHATNQTAHDVPGSSAEEKESWGHRLKQGALDTIDEVSGWFTDIFGSHKGKDEDSGN